jgi:putative flippase GtrA
MNENESIVIIPAYNPDERLLNLLKEIKEKTNYNIIIINDGSSNNCFNIFKQCKEYGTVLEHLFNKGKGDAIKTVLSYISKKSSSTRIIITADADGQHKVEDIISVCNSAKDKNGMIIGSRKFIGNVPLRSKLGNRVTRNIFALISGKKLIDTQTGLRAFNSEMIPFMLDVEGSRYEYEMNVLLACSKKNIEITEVPIETIYIDKNESSHFRPIRDSIMIYKNILKFSLSSIISFILDYSIFSIMIYLTKGFNIADGLLVSNILARCISSSANYYTNKKYVFNNNDKIVQTASKYFILAAAILFINTTLLEFIVQNTDIKEMIAKILVEIVLFIVSWIIQKNLIFNSNERNKIRYENK